MSYDIQHKSVHVSQTHIHVGYCLSASLRAAASFLSSRAAYLHPKWRSLRQSAGFSTDQTKIGSHPGKIEVLESLWRLAICIVLVNRFSDQFWSSKNINVESSYARSKFQLFFASTATAAAIDPLRAEIVRYGVLDHIQHLSLDWVHN